MTLSHEHLQLYQARSLHGCYGLLEHFLNLFLDPPGCIIFLYCCLLSRGLEKVRADLQGEIGHLIQEDACCDQAAVNLMLAGMARSAVGTHA